MTQALVVALACLVSWTSAMPHPDPVADPGPAADLGFRRFGGLWYGGDGYEGRGYGYGAKRTEDTAAAFVDKDIPDTGPVVKAL